MKENIAKEKAKKFAIRIVKLSKFLQEKNEYILANQILRSGTSIGANIAESEFAVSKNDFSSKIYISLKESSETLYWLDILFETDIISKELYDSLYADCLEITKILNATTKTLNAN